MEESSDAYGMNSEAVIVVKLQGTSEGYPHCGQSARPLRGAFSI